MRTRCSASPALPPAAPPPPTGAAHTKQGPKGQASCAWVRESHQSAEDIRCTIPKGQEGDAMGEHVKGVQCRGPHLPRPFLGQELPPCLLATLLTALPLQGAGPGPKDTATLWESLSMVEMADKLGQKLWRKRKVNVSRVSGPYSTPSQNPGTTECQPPGTPLSHL